MLDNEEERRAKANARWREWYNRNKEGNQAKANARWREWYKRNKEDNGSVTGLTRRRHGLSEHNLYSCWSRMMRQCYNHRDPQYKDYGGRGITVCESWRMIENFIEYIENDLADRPQGKSLARIDNDRNYEPGNVRWATHEEQQTNRRLDIAYANTDAVFDLAHEIASAQAPSDLMAIWFAYAKRRFDMMTNQTKELTEVGQK